MPKNKEKIGGGAVPIAALIRLGMGYGISYANAPGVGEQTYIGRPPFFWGGGMSLTHNDLSNLCILISLLFLEYILINAKTFRQMTRFANFYGVIMVLSFIVSWQIFNAYFNFLVFLILFFVSYKIWQFKKK